MYVLFVLIAISLVAVMVFPREDITLKFPSIEEPPVEGVCCSYNANKNHYLKKFRCVKE